MESVFRFLGRFVVIGGKYGSSNRDGLMNITWHTRNKTALFRPSPMMRCIQGEGHVYSFFFVPEFYMVVWSRFNERYRRVDLELDSALRQRILSFSWISCASFGLQRASEKRKTLDDFFISLTCIRILTNLVLQPRRNKEMVLSQNHR